MPPAPASSPAAARAAATASSSPPSWSTRPASRRVGAGPDSPLGDRLDRAAVERAARGDVVEEAAIGLVEAALHQLALGLVEGSQARVEASVRASRKGSWVAPRSSAWKRSVPSLPATTPIEPVRVPASARMRLGARGDVVAARGGDVGHRDDHRLLARQQLDPAQDQVGGERRAAGAVDAQDDGLDVVVLGEVREESRSRSSEPR